MNQPFVLAEWELPAGSTIERSAPATIRFPPGILDEERAMLGRTLPFANLFPLILVRSEDEEDEANWTPITPLEAQCLHHLTTLSDKRWSSHYTSQIAYGRIVWFENAMAVLHPDGRANWYALNTYEAVFFHWHNGSYDWTLIPAYDWKEALGQELQNPQSEANFAYRWAFMTREQQRETVWQCEQGWDNLTTVLHWILRVHPELDSNNLYSVAVSLRDEGNHINLNIRSLSEGDEAKY